MKVLCRLLTEGAGINDLLATWTEAGAWWETGVPKSLSGHDPYRQSKAHQLRWT